MVKMGTNFLKRYYSGETYEEKKKTKWRRNRGKGMSKGEREREKRLRKSRQI